VKHFIETYKAEPSEMLYIGDDLFDKSIMEIVGHPFCPADACVDIKEVCGQNNILSMKGGNNVIAELVNTLQQRRLVGDCTMEDIENLDKKEVF
jgi:3-deoxy-D-manno-octulosonate 8-phosphate phosphatase (KDO 8-P phosphatase)